MICPECKTQIDEFYVNAPATVETLKQVGAEVTLKELREQLRHDATGMPYLPLFKLDDVLDTLDNHLDHHTLELGDEQTEFFCPQCNATLPSEAVWADVEGHGPEPDGQRIAEGGRIFPQS